MRWPLTDAARITVSVFADGTLVVMPAKLGSWRVCVAIKLGFLRGMVALHSGTSALPKGIWGRNEKSPHPPFKADAGLWSVIETKLLSVFSMSPCLTVGLSDVAAGQLRTLDRAKF